ncbi:uncharacterized protein LOC127074303 [Lathyrus oleraceus]|uniref:Transmembrane protein n=1 Tax=Pisum sativum TaxID=3888 RepID=A0A9D5GZK3_PEA|nr:uncharacterized protein LOC127074303 [Pisum sativum]XP_050871584.1 uncharacterized protein LOC127074303 [Pisum sativum]KAI5446614.1 hypothetical protein KIW84_014450 [Pisum sativum]
MDLRNGKEKGIEVDLESGLPLIEDNSRRISNSITAKQGKMLFAQFSGEFVGGFVRGEVGTSSYFNESNLSEVSFDVMKVMNKIPAKENRKKVSNKKAAKPPRPPKGPSLDEADYRLIRELSELATLKRARVERMKALKKMKNAKPNSSNSTSALALVFTVLFFVVIIFQGMSSGKSSVASFQGSPISGGGGGGGLISVQYQLNPSSDSNAPGSESPNFVQRVAGSDLNEKVRRDSG